jgi:hypothetical protein
MLLTKNLTLKQAIQRHIQIMADEMNHMANPLPDTLQFSKDLIGDAMTVLILVIDQ